MSGTKRKFNVGTSSEEEDEVAGPSTATKEDLEGDSDNETSEEESVEEESKDKQSQVHPRTKFYLSLAKLTKKQFEDKEFFNKLVAEEIASKKQRPGRGGGQGLDPKTFHWRDGEIKIKKGKEWRGMLYASRQPTHAAQLKVEKGRHQTYLAITIPRTDIEGKSLKEIWAYCRVKVKRRGHFVGETFSIEFGVRPSHFRRCNISAIQDEMVKSDSRCFEIAVIITESEEERKSLEEYIIYYLMEQEENNSKNDKSGSSEIPNQPRFTKESERAS